MGVVEVPNHRHRTTPEGERHARVYRQISGSDQRNAERLRPSGIPRFIKTAQLWVLGCEREGLRVNRNGAIPLAEPHPVQGLPGSREASQPEGEAGERPAVYGAGSPGGVFCAILRRTRTRWRGPLQHSEGWPADWCAHSAAWNSALRSNTGARIWFVGRDPAKCFTNTRSIRKWDGCMRGSRPGSRSTSRWD